MRRKVTTHCLLVSVIASTVWAHDWSELCYRNEVVPVWNETQLSNDYYNSKTSLTAKCYENEAFLEWSNGELSVEYIFLKYLCRNFTNVAEMDYIKDNDRDYSSSEVFNAASWDECIFFGCFQKDGEDFYYTFMPVSCTWLRAEECDPESSDCYQNITTCNTTIGKFICSCYTGYTGNGFSCQNIDECSEDRDTCNETISTCIDTIGNYTCECNSGYEGPVTNCTNIDECTLGTHTCHDDATCTDTAGEFNCTCKSGFEGDGFNCTNIDECMTNGHNCHQNAICNDTVGSFNCSCTEGYEGDGVLCSNIDECMTNGHNCHQNAICNDTVGSFNCSCTEGYEGDGVLCSNIDECTLGTHTCHDDATCTDTAGEYNCTCKSGFEGDGFNCTNIDECVTGGHNCHWNATCNDTVGGFYCTCTDGYKGDGVLCTDINECNDNPCHANASCINTPGNYSCHCDNGYTGDGKVCTKMTSSIRLIALMLTLVLMIPIGFLIIRVKKRLARHDYGRKFLSKEKLRCDPQCNLVSITAPPYMLAASTTTLVSELDDLHFESKEKTISTDAGIRIKETQESPQETGSNKHCSFRNDYIKYASENSWNTTAEHCDVEMAEFSEQQDS